MEKRFQMKRTELEGNLGRNQSQISQYRQNLECKEDKMRKRVEKTEKQVEQVGLNPKR